MNEMSDAQLVHEAQQGNEQALEIIYQRYEKSLYYIAYKITNNKDDAQDALQDTFLQVSKSIKDLKRPDYLKLWLNRIIAGKCRDIFRKNKTLSVDMDDVQFSNHYPEHRKEYVPEHQLHFKTDQEVVDYYISQLPYAQREAIILTYFQNLSLQDIATLLDEPIGTIKSRVHLAKKTLHQRLSSYESRNDIKLNFRSVGMDAFLSSILLQEAQHFMTPVKTGMLFTSKPHTASFHSFVAGTGGKLVIASAVTVTMGTGVLAYQEIQKSLSQDQQIQQQTLHSNITLEDFKIRNDQDAYFLLMNWAMNEEQMKLKEQDEIEQYRPIYEYLKENKSSFYDALNQNGMTTVLEQYFE